MYQILLSGYMVNVMLFIFYHNLKKKKLGDEFETIHLKKKKKLILACLPRITQPSRPWHEGMIL